MVTCPECGSDEVEVKNLSQKTNCRGDMIINKKQARCFACQNVWDVPV